MRFRQSCPELTNAFAIAPLGRSDLLLDGLPYRRSIGRVLNMLTLQAPEATGAFLLSRAASARWISGPSSDLSASPGVDTIMRPCAAQDPC
jgi:hypothetical protein